MAIKPAWRECVVCGVDYDANDPDEQLGLYTQCGDCAEEIGDDDPNDRVIAVEEVPPGAGQHGTCEVTVVHRSAIRGTGVGRHVSYGQRYQPVGSTRGWLAERSRAGRRWYGEK